MNDSKSSAGLAAYLACYVLLTTLFSFYFYRLGAAPLPLIAMGMLVPLVLVRGRTFLRSAAPALIAAGYIGIAIIISAVRGWGSEWPLLWARTSLPLLVLTTGAGVLIAIRDYPREFWRACRIALAVHLLFFYVQLALYLGFGVAVDFLAPVTGESQRVFGGTYQLPVIGRFIRAAGLNNEPGTFVNVVFPLYLAYKALTPVGARSGWLMDALTLAAVALSFAVFGYVFMVVLAMLFMFRRPGWGLVGAISLGGMFVAIYDFYLYQRFAVAEDGGLGFRIAALKAFFSQGSWSEMALGYGLITDVSPLLGDTVINDLGVWFSVLVSGGLAALLLLACAMVPKIRLFNAWDWALLSVFFLSKLSFTYTYFWMIYFIVLYRPRCDVHERR